MARMADAPVARGLLYARLAGTVRAAAPPNVEVVRCGQRVFCRAADIRVPRLDPILSKAGNCSRLHPL